jgi:hypothetical protein
MPAGGRRSVTLLAVLVIASCASPPRPALEHVTQAWNETLQEWGAWQRGRADALEGEEKDEHLERHMDVLRNLHLLNMVAILHTVSDGEWSGVVRIDGEMRTGSPVAIRLSTCPPGRRFALYSSSELSHPRPHPSGNHDYWILDLGRQRLEGEGTIDARGEAAITVSLPDDPSLAGAFRGFQATILKEGEKEGGAALGFTTAHGRRVR